MGPYKPLRTWVDDHPLLYGNNGSLDPSTYIFSCDFFFTYRDPGRKIRSDHHGMTQETPRGPSLMDDFLTISRKESFPKISRKGATIKPPTIFQGLKKTPSSVRLHFTVFFLESVPSIHALKFIPISSPFGSRMRPSLGFVFVGDFLRMNDPMEKTSP